MLKRMPITLLISLVRKMIWWRYFVKIKREVFQLTGRIVEEGIGLNLAEDTFKRGG